MILICARFKTPFVAELMSIPPENQWELIDPRIGMLHHAREQLVGLYAINDPSLEASPQILQETSRGNGSRPRHFQFAQWPAHHFHPKQQECYACTDPWDWYTPHLLRMLAHHHQGWHEIFVRGFWNPKLKLHICLWASILEGIDPTYRHFSSGNLEGKHLKLPTKITSFSLQLVTPSLSLPKNLLILFAPTPFLPPPTTQPPNHPIPIRNQQPRHFCTGVGTLYPQRSMLAVRSSGKSKRSQASIAGSGWMGGWHRRQVPKSAYHSP